MEPPMLPSTNSPPAPDTNAAPGPLPAPSLRATAMQWIARADWIEAEDGTVVAVAPGYRPSTPPRLSASVTLWPSRRRLIVAAPEMLAALELAERFMAGFEDDELQDGINDRLATLRAAIAAARA
jgi:hypothetical protein